jgi:hypothetical protein
MSYGYNSTVAFSLSTATVDDFAIDLLDRLANKRTRKEVSDFFECIVLVVILKSLMPPSRRKGDP